MPLSALEVETAGPHQNLARLAPREFDVLIGINLLREGLDLPEVVAVAILDATKRDSYGARRRSSRRLDAAPGTSRGGQYLYRGPADGFDESSIDETNRRRASSRVQRREQHHPMSIIKSVDMELARIVEADYVTVPVDDASLDAASANIRATDAARGDAAPA